MSAIQADALRLPIADHSVDLIVTSPPYFGLRSYANGGIGEESTPAEYVDALIAATREMIRVLKPSGSIFINLGDKFSGGTGGGAPSSSSTLRGNGHIGGGPKQQAGAGRASTKYTTATPNKSLMLLPARYAIRCVDELGLILRRDIIWEKKNGLPESCVDRCRSSHEYWFHMVTQPRYYAAIDEIREPHSDHTLRYYGSPGAAKQRPANANLEAQEAKRGRTLTGVNAALGKLPGSVWKISTEPLHLPDELGVEHYAAFPSEWPRRLILGWSPREICTACGEGRRPIVSSQRLPRRPNEHNAYGAGKHGTGKHSLDTVPEVHILGYGCCPDIDAPATPGIVLDPFGGTGTTAAVAQTLGRTGISVDLAHDYARAAVWRANDPGLRAKVLGVEKPAPVMAGQQGLFE
jgi:DNA modification methylase